MKMLTPSRRQVLVLGASAVVSTAARAQTNDSRFGDFLQSLWPKAKRESVSRDTFDRVLGGLAPDSGLEKQATAQAEFERPLWDYYAGAVSPARVARGRAARAQWHTELTSIARRSGVPAEIVVAAWGMESDFGAASGTRDCVRTLASLAFYRASDTFADEVVAALVMLDRFGIARDKLRGSWAGAMGQPQFLPSAYLRFAVAYKSGQTADIWTSVPDVLASIANFLKLSGWTASLPWGLEVRVPRGFAFAALEGDFEGFAKAGFAGVANRLPASGKASLYFPAGAQGPAFLLSDNYWVLKQYNNSDSYALSLACLGDRIAGGAGLATAWPKGLVLLPRADRLLVQQVLTREGLYGGEMDGRFGPASRAAVHAWQLKAGFAPADGFATPALVKAMSKGRGPT